MEIPEFVDKAPCRNADPWLFDQYQLDLAQPGLAYCQRCPYWENCISLVKPQSSHYDGIVGGAVWRNGKVLARLSSDEPQKLIVGGEGDDYLEYDETLEFRGSALLPD
jgi:hypothetical protein